MRGGIGGDIAPDHLDEAGSPHHGLKGREVAAQRLDQPRPIGVVIDIQEGGLCRLGTASAETGSIADPGTPRPNLAMVLDTTQEGRGGDWHPKLDYDG